MIRSTRRDGGRFYQVAMVRGGVIAALLLSAVAARGQTASLGARVRAERAAGKPIIPPREAPKTSRNRIYDAYSWITTRPKPPRRFRPGDLITIIVRENRQFESEAELRTRKRVDLTSELEAFIKLINGGVGSSQFLRGKPNIDYKLNSRIQNTGNKDREDRLTLRITGRIIDVKPNGLLVIEARGLVQHDEEVSVMTLTGTCRKEDVTADNTILSTQLADKEVKIVNKGAMRDIARRGWLLKLVDWVSPF
ncbi:MAG: hypothetical protein D6788_09005 [Planctomycetota bacterium]|nr:MAG: hypothetical protein D6788_09005 [Planctomycetota bacterium]